MNILIVVNAFLAYDGNLNSSKGALEDFGGVNIISQFCLFFIIPFIIYTYQYKIKTNKWVIFFLIIVLFFRSYFMSERVALLEIVLPIIITYVTIKNRKILVTKFLKYFAILLLFFMFLELTRQFRNEYKDEDTDIGFKISWTLERFFDYYGDTQNKFYYVLENDLSFTTANYFSWGERVIYRLTGGRFHIDTEGVNIDFGEYVWKDFTNIGGLTLAYTDFGLFLGIIFLLSFFGLFFKLWFKLKKGHLYAWCVYPFFFIWIVEFARYNGVFLTRSFIPFIVFNIVFLTFEYVRPYKKKTTFE